MWSAIRAFVSRLFGNTPTEPTPGPPDPVQQSQVPQARWQLIRLETASNGVRGELHLNGERIADTLEGLENLASGKYPLSLKQAGGLHATYSFRFGAMHKGLITIAGKDQNAYLQMGHNPAYAYGSILVGTGYDQQEGGFVLLGTEPAYRMVYEELVSGLASGQATMLAVSSR